MFFFVQAELEDTLEKKREIEKSMSASSLRNLQEQIGKLYWVNKELINQIRERDNQTKRLQVRAAKTLQWLKIMVVKTSLRQR